MENHGIGLKIQIFLFRLIYKPLIRRSARHILQGRLLDPELPENGRWLRAEVNQLLKSTWERVDELLPGAELDIIPTAGNRGNVFLAVITTAAYQVLVESGQSQKRAADLVGDVGWKIYEMGIKLISLPFRLTTRDQSKRIERTIKAMMVFPFSAPGRPGYEVKVQKKENQLLTHWTWCPPQAFVRKLTEKDGDKGELDAFYRSWCLYDWPGADLMADDGQRGHYRRKRTQSRGDSVCDMCWLSKVPGVEPVTEP